MNRRKSRQALDRLLHRFALDVSRWPNDRNGNWRRQTLLSARDIDLVIDVGANIGQYAKGLREYGYCGRILSLEPMREAYDKLVFAGADDPEWVAVRSAAGSKRGELPLNVTSNSVSSSILPMLHRHLQADPESRVTHTEQVPVDRLDTLAAEDVAAATAPFVKIDTQGFEHDVLEGASGILSHLAGVELELSLVQLYEGQQLWQEQIAYLKERGFRVAGLNAGFWDRATGETLQIDGLFVRADNSVLKTP